MVTRDLMEPQTQGQPRMAEVASIIGVLRSLAVFFLTMDIHFTGVEGITAQEVAQHLEMGKKLLAAGQLADALSHYHAAVDGDPSNYMTYFKRATVFLALGKSRSALPDLDKVVELKPDFTAARIQRANVLLKQGKLDEAEKDYKTVIEKDPENAEVKGHLAEIRPMKEEIQTAHYYYDRGDYEAAISILSRLVEICPWNAELRELRADCYIAMGEYIKAIGDVRSTTKLRNDNTAAYYKVSKLHYDIGEADESLMEIRECLKLDPDHKQCFPHYKKVKKLVKQLQSARELSNEQRFEECIDKANQILKTEPEVFPYVLRAKSHICHCQSKIGHVRDAVNACNEVLHMDPDNVDALCDRAEAFIADEQYEQGVNDYQKAQGIDGESRKVHEGLKKAQKLLKQSLKRDYYKILGVKRNARKKEIIKAYRKLAVQWHPDKFEGDDKKKAEKMFIDIASAKEVLTDPEKRQKFDNGEDPLDPEQQQGGQGGPFWQQGFNPFGAGGGGFQFKFNFN
ncbi:dnaJ homolog subfamily C member 3-like [Liolophura sinensis]|uniref:dnaJ homolog subfamily C member 3-like n=1 Tax=Liolophura sinensis TaxID=3198878 RepID=UPI0031584FC8